MNSEEKDKAVGACLAGVLLIIGAPFFAIWQAWVAAKVWDWFLAKPCGFSITTAMFFGAFTVASMFRPWKPTSKDAKPDLPGALGYVTLGPLFILGFAWVANHFLFQGIK